MVCSHIEFLKLILAHEGKKFYVNTLWKTFSSCYTVKHSVRYLSFESPASTFYKRLKGIS